MPSVYGRTDSFLPFLDSLNQCPTRNEQRVLIDNCTDKEFGFLCHCLRGLLHQSPNFVLPTADLNTVRRELVPHKRALKKLISRLPVEKKRALYHQEGGGFLVSTLIGAVVPLITKLVQAATKKK